jgi:hypothetical protein
VHAKVNKNAKVIATLSDAIYYSAELRIQAFESAKLLDTALKQAGFRVQTGGAGFPTNVWVESGSGKPKILIMTEIDVAGWRPTVRDTHAPPWTADYVICCVPLGVLQGRSIRFEPALPRAHADAIARIGFGPVTKAAVEF